MTKECFGKSAVGQEWRTACQSWSCAVEPEQLLHSSPLQSSAGQGHSTVLAPPSVIHCTITCQRDSYAPLLNSQDVALRVKEAEESVWKRSLWFPQSQTPVLPWLAQPTLGAGTGVCSGVTSAVAVADLRLSFQGSTCRGRGCRRAH